MNSISFCVLKTANYAQNAFIVVFIKIYYSKNNKNNLTDKHFLRTKPISYNFTTNT